jgi:hypothetical protein
MQLEVIDNYGRVRPYRRGDRLADGERLRVPLTFMDAAARATRDALVQKYGWHDHQPRGGFVRGYAFADTTPPRSSRDAAAIAYKERFARLENAWRKDAAADDARTQCVDAAQARALADRAWLDKKERLQNSWRVR